MAIPPIQHNHNTTVPEEVLRSLFNLWEHKLWGETNAISGDNINLLFFSLKENDLKMQSSPSQQRTPEFTLGS